MEEEIMRSDFYLAHPLNTRHEVREKIQVPLQELGYSVINPFYDSDLTPRQDIAVIDAGREKLYDIGPIRAREIVRSDLDAIDRSKAIIAYLPHPGIGTPMEIFYTSHVLRKYTFIVTPENYLRHPWIQTYGDVKRKTIAEIIATIWKEDGGFEI